MRHVLYYYHYYFFLFTNFYVCIYAYSSFSPHNDITTGNVLILRFSPINDNFNFLWNYY
jgi:hypothetical protein